MKRHVFTALAALLALCALFVAGCGSKTGVSLTTKNGKVEVETDKGKVEVEKKAPTEAELGVPIYPGAEPVENASGSVTEGDKTYSANQLVTVAPVSDVLAWYRGKLSGKPSFMDMTGPEGGLMTFQDGAEVKMVTIGPGAVDQRGKTVIVIASGTGTVPQLP